MTASCRLPIRPATRRSGPSTSCARLIRAEGRDPASVGLEVWVSPGIGGPDDWRKELSFWKKAGVTHVTCHTTYVSGHHKRIAGTGYADHLDAITRYRAAVADLL